MDWHAGKMFGSGGRLTLGVNPLTRTLEVEETGVEYKS